MNDPVSASPDPADYETTVERVGQAIAWYSERILAERRSAAPDPDRLDQLISRHRACLEDQERLEEAGPEELARIAAAYDALLTELESDEQ
ncbi:hypothetical protein [Streptomyces halobius]|uniref:Uncharacterized protein n=1 Tax=Streptomyces halobius TaxID=2879846 RepID=A0ABY4M175_9ACTN|nr:hypothetical protein [Streptomyces halobius]UQA91470.1 hypothetical protein K9S39_05890 [Streptomyces halobius]